MWCIFAQICLYSNAHWSLEEYISPFVDKRFVFSDAWNDFHSHSEPERKTVGETAQERERKRDRERERADRKLARGDSPLGCIKREVNEKWQEVEVKGTQRHKKLNWKKYKLELSYSNVLTADTLSHWIHYYYVCLFFHSFLFLLLCGVQEILIVDQWLSQFSDSSLISVCQSHHPGQAKQQAKTEGERETDRDTEREFSVTGGLARRLQRRRKTLLYVNGDRKLRGQNKGFRELLSKADEATATWLWHEDQGFLPVCKRLLQV